MLITDIFEARKPFISMEFFPPRSVDTLTRFPEVVACLCQQKPDFFTVTFGAGGSTQAGTCQTVEHLLTETAVPTVAHLAGAGLGPADLCLILDRYQGLGVQNIFVVRGDEAKDGSVVPHPEGFQYASQLITFIRERYDFTIGCAGYPEGHVAAPSLDRDIDYLYEKITSGADYVVTQFFHDNQFYFDYVEKCYDKGIRVPIIPGIMPVYSQELTQRLATMCGASIPDSLQHRLEELGPEAAQQLGVDFAVAQCRQLLSYGVPGLHFYTMDRSDSTVAIVEQLRAENLL